MSTHLICHTFVEVIQKSIKPELLYILSDFIAAGVKCHVTALILIHILHDSAVFISFYAPPQQVARILLYRPKF